MKKHLLIGASLLALGITTTVIYAQVTGTSVVDKMKAVAHSFTLATTLNPSDSGLTSEPVKGKKTGDILTAGEWNRMLELVGGSGTGNSVYFTALHTSAQSIPANAIGNAQGTLVAQYTDSNGAVNKTTGLFTAPVSGYYYLNGHVHYFTTPDANTFVQFIGGGGTKSVWGTRSSGSDKPMNEVNTVWYLSAGETVGLYLWNDKPSTNVYARFTGILINGGGNAGASGSGWVDVPLTDTNPFDKTCEYRFTLNTNGDNASIGGTNPVFYASAIDPFAITYIAHSSVVTHILASSKNVFRNNGTSVYTVTKIEKLCGGGSGGGGSSSSELQLSNESPTTVPNFIEATKYCKNLTEGGYSDWRFPNLSELFVFAPISTDTNFLWTNAVDYSQGTANANPQYWGKLRMSDGYFSATSGPGDDVAYVRCVRGS